MTQEQIAQLREAGRMALHETARRAAIDAMADISLAESGKNEVIRRCLSNIPTKDGWLDEAAFREAVKAEAKAVGAFLATLMPQGVRGMGGAPVQLTEAEQKAERKALKRLTEAKNDIFAGILGDPVAAKFATEGRPF